MRPDLSNIAMTAINAKIQELRTMIESTPLLDIFEAEDSVNLLKTIRHIVINANTRNYLKAGQYTI